MLTQLSDEAGWKNNENLLATVERNYSCFEIPGDVYHNVTLLDDSMQHLAIASDITSHAKIDECTADFTRKDFTDLPTIDVGQTTSRVLQQFNHPYMDTSTSTSRETSLSATSERMSTVLSNANIDKPFFSRSKSDGNVCSMTDVCNNSTQITPGRHDDDLRNELSYFESILQNMGKRDKSSNEVGLTYNDRNASDQGSNLGSTLSEIPGKKRNQLN